MAEAAHIALRSSRTNIMALTTEEQSFLDRFLEYHKEVTARFDRLEVIMQDISKRQAIFESEGSKAAIKDLFEKYYSIDKRQSLLERGLDETKQFRETVESDLKAIKAAQLSEDDLKMFRKGKAVFIVMAIIFGLFQAWQVVKDFIKIP